MTTGAYILVILSGAITGTVLGVTHVVRKRERERAARALEHAYRAVVAISKAAETIDEFAREEHRTHDSMQGSFGGVSKHPTVRAAQTRGLEVYRNGYVQKYQQQVRTALEQYNKEAEALVAAVDANPLLIRVGEEEA